VYFFSPPPKKASKREKEDGLIDYFMKMWRMKRDEMHIERDCSPKRISEKKI
jgi:hypothetical protein